MAYLSASARERIYKLAALSSFCEDAAGRCAEADGARLREIAGMADALLAEWTQNLASEERAGLMRYIKHNRLIVAPEGIDRRRQYILEHGEIEALMADVDFGCAICLHDERQAKRCRRRKLLMRLGIDGSGARLGDCPYQGGVLAAEADAGMTKKG